MDVCSMNALHRIHVYVNACESFYFESAIFHSGNFHNVQYTYIQETRQSKGLPSEFIKYTQCICLPIPMTGDKMVNYQGFTFSAIDLFCQITTPFTYIEEFQPLNLVWKYKTSGFYDHR